MTAFIPAYDVELLKKCLEACRKIVRVHQRHRVPATFFIVGRLLETEGQAYRDVLGDAELFETASHTYSHRMLLDNPICGPAVPPEVVHEEVFRGKECVEKVFRKECVGLRPGCGFEAGFSGAPHVVSELAGAGLRYASSRLWGPFYTVPAPLEQAYTYEAEGHPELWEFPGHGWHENLLKGHNATPGRLLLWPPVYPEMQLCAYVQTPEEEFNVHRFFLDRAIQEGREYVSLVWHPWSLDRFDPGMKMLELIFGYAAERGMPFLRFEDLWRSKSGAAG